MLKVKKSFLINKDLGKSSFNKLNSKFVKFFSTNGPIDNNEEKKGIFNKLKKYGKFGLFFYTTYVIVAFAGFYALLEYKILKIEKIIDLSEKYGVNKYVDIRKKVNEHPKSANIITAYLLNQIFEVIRLPTTIMFLAYYAKKFKK